MADILEIKSYQYYAFASRHTGLKAVAQCRCQTGSPEMRNGNLPLHAPWSFESSHQNSFLSLALRSKTRMRRHSAPVMSEPAVGIIREPDVPVKLDFLTTDQFTE